MRPKDVEKVTKGGIFIPDSSQERERYATTEGVIVAVGPAAFTEFTREEWDGRQPRVGESVIYAKYAGLHVTGDDGVEYVLMNDEDLAAIRRKEA